jgi:hypothetical protein
VDVEDPTAVLPASGVDESGVERASIKFLDIETRDVGRVQPQSLGVGAGDLGGEGIPVVAGHRAAGCGQRPQIRADAAAQVGDLGWPVELGIEGGEPSGAVVGDLGASRLLEAVRCEPHSVGDDAELLSGAAAKLRLGERRARQLRGQAAHPTAHLGRDGERVDAGVELADRELERPRPWPATQRAEGFDVHGRERLTPIPGLSAQAWHSG